jgi:hypothetical protein
VLSTIKHESFSGSVLAAEVDGLEKKRGVGTLYITLYNFRKIELNTK